MRDSLSMEPEPGLRFAPSGLRSLRYFLSYTGIGGGLPSGMPTRPAMITVDTIT